MTLAQFSHFTAECFILHFLNDRSLERPFLFPILHVQLHLTVIGPGHPVDTYHSSLMVNWSWGLNPEY